MYFSHDTFGYLTQGQTPVVQGPSNPCHTMKAVTEGIVPGQDGIPGPRVSYAGVRLTGVDNYTRWTSDHGATVSVSWSHVQNPLDNQADLGSDFSFWWRDCNMVLQPNSNFVFEVPVPCFSPPPPSLCASQGQPTILALPDADDWEAPELVRIRLNSATSPLDPATQVVTSEAFSAGWVIQDECETGTLFRYPDPLPPAGSHFGVTVQLTTDVSGYTPEFKNVTLADHVGQNYPYAATEVVAEDSWLEFAVALLDENGAKGDNSLSGTLLRPPFPVRVTLDVLNDLDLQQKPSACGAQPAPWGHYATEDLADTLENDFIIQQWDPSILPNGSWVAATPSVGGQYEITIPITDQYARMRFFATNNDDTFLGLQNETYEVVHIHVSGADYVDPPSPPAFVPDLNVGWSSDYRFIIQENSGNHCPL